MRESSRIDEAGSLDRQAQNAQAATAAASNLSTPSILTIDKPAAGQMKVVDVSSAKHLKFGFDMADCKITVLDVDAILIFADGSKLVLPGLAMQMVMADAPVMQFGAATVEPQVVLAKAGDIKLIDQLPQFALSESARSAAGPDAAPAQAQVVQVTASQSFPNTPGPKTRPFDTQGTGNGDALIETTSRYARKASFDESQSSGTKSQGSITDTSQKLVITDTPIFNTPPVMTSRGRFAQDENGRLVTTLTATDADPSSNITFSISGGRDVDRFAVNSTSGKLYFVERPDFEANSSASGDTTYQIEVQASDGKAADRQSVTVTLNNVNEMPNGISITSSTISENTVLGSILGTVAGDDPDAGAQLTYAFAPGGDAGGRFAIDGQSGVVSIIRGDLIDFEASQSQLIVVRVTDQDGLYLDTPIVVAVTDANDAPVINSNGGGASAAVTVFENTRAVTTVSASDADAGSVIRYAISGGADASRFTVNTVTGEINFIAGIDFEVPTDANLDNIYNIVVQASDGLGGNDQQNLAIAVVNANDPPDNVQLTTNTVGENAANGTVIGRFEGTDPDTNSVLRYSFLTGGDADGRFGINAQTGELTVLDGSRLDFEDRSSHTILVRVTDQGGLSLDGAFVINLTDVNEAPVIISDGGGASAAFAVAEGTVQATRVTAVDPEAAPLVYSIVGGADSSRFAINAQTGVVAFVSAPDYEAPIDADGDNRYDIVVQVTDGTFVDTQSISITVQDVGEPPTITSNGGGAIASVSLFEGTSAVTVITATDPDASPVLTYTIIGGADAALFSINSATGALSLNAPADFENPLDAGGNNNYDIMVQVSDGILTDTQLIIVSVLNVNDAPIIVSGGGGATAVVTATENSTTATTVVATDIDAGATLIYTIAGGVDASRFTINSNTGVLTFIAAPDFETPGDAGNNNVYDVVVQVLDGVGGMDSQSLAVTVTNQNEAPVITSNGGGASAAVSLQENLSAVTTVTATDLDTATTLSYAIIGGADAAKFTIDSATGALVFIAPPDFDIAGDTGGNNIYDVLVQVSDGAGGTDTQAVAVTITNQNEAPVITSGGGGASAIVTLQENTPAVTTLTATDPDAATTLTYTITGGADAGRFTINPTTGALTFASGTDFEAPSDVGADNTYDVVVQVSDGAGGVDSQSLAVTVTNQNEAPVITSNGGGASAALSLAENSTGVSLVTATDVDAGTSLGFSIVGGADAALFTINASTGVLSFASGRNFEMPADAGADNTYDVTVQVSDGLGGADTQALAVSVTDINEAPEISSDGGGAAASISLSENATYVTTVAAVDPDAASSQSFSIAGGTDAARFVINSSTGVLSFIAAPDFEAPADVGADNIYDVIVQVSDGLGGSDSQTMAVTVTNANEAPVITSNGGGTSAALSIAENGTSLTTVVATDPDAAASLSYGIFGGADAALFTINAATGALAFITGPDFEAPADSGADNVYDVVVRVSDGAGGADTQAIAVTVTGINEAPVITSDGGLATASLTRQENSVAVTTIVAADPDAGASLTYSITGGPDAALFAVNSTTGVLTFIAAPDFEAPGDSNADNIYSVVVQASDGLGSIDTQTLSIAITNQNEAPVITSDGGGPAAALSVQENSAAVTTVIATDADAGAAHTFSIIGGADAASFTINASTGMLSFMAMPDREMPADSGADNIYDVTVQVSDGLGGTDTQAIAVSVTDRNDTAPTIISNGGGSSAAISIGENTTAVTTVAATDPDLVGTISYAITGGADQGAFSINATTGVLTFITAPDVETPTDIGGNNVYDLVVSAFDGVNTTVQTIAVTVTNQNEAPLITSDGGGPSATLGVAENGAAVTTVTASDVDAGATLTYSIVAGGDAALFAINATTGALRFLAAPDFENPLDGGANNIYDVVVQVSDGLGGIDTQALAITVSNLNEAPLITSNGGLATASVNVNENQTAVTTVAASDPDSGAVLAYAIVPGADAAKFTINAATGVLTFIASPDFEMPQDVGTPDNVYGVTVEVTDGLGGIDMQTVLVTVQDVNEAPVITSDLGGPTASITVTENFSTVTNVTASDPDSGAILTYAIVGGVDAALFSINSTTGALVFVAAPDFETSADSGGNNIYDVMVQVSDGTLTDTQSIAVTVTDSNDETPVIISNGGGNNAAISMAENGTAITTVAATDSDVSGTLTYSIAGGADAALFTINASTGVLGFLAGRDFETPADVGADNIYDVVVRASDGVQFDDQAISVTITDTNDVAPSITSNGGSATASISMAENTTAVTTVTATDPDTVGTITYALAGGADAALFTINASTGVLGFLAGRDFETPADVGADNIYDVVVRASDGVQFDDQAISVTITDAFIVSSGTAFNDTADFSASTENNAYTALGGDDVVTGSAFADTIDGGNGNDVITGGAGPDNLTGGSGYDTLRYDTDTVGVTVDLAAQTAGGAGSQASGDTITGFEAVHGGLGADSLTAADTGSDIDGGAGNDTISGGLGIDALYGQAGDDLINGADGNDVISGGTGADTLSGGSGTADMLSYSGSVGAVNVNLSSDIAAFGDAQGDVISGFEGVSGGLGNDSLVGSSTGNILFGDTGNDTLLGLDGADTLQGGADDDVMDGGAGDDELDGGTGTNTSIYSGARADYTITLSGSTYTITDLRGGNPDGVDNVTNVEQFQFADGTIAAGSVTDVAGSNGDDSITGTADANVLLGQGGQDVIMGGDGNDRINGGSGDDNIAGGRGADSLDGGTGSDIVAYYTDTAGVTVNLATMTASGVGSEAAGDTISGFEGVIGGAGNDSLTGDGGLNALYGDAGNDTINGAAGDDYILGGNGADLLDGGADNDIIFAGAGQDTLTGGNGINQLWGEGANLLANSSFETAALAEWTVSGNVEQAMFIGTTGTHSARFSGADTPNDGILSQTVVTENGLTYTLAFDLGAWGASTSQQLRVEIISNGTTVIDETFTITGAVPLDWDSFDRSFVALGASTVIRLSDVSTSTNSIDLHLDNVRLFQDFDGADTLTNGSGGGELHGGGGQDSVGGGTFAEVLYGEAGDDTLSGDGGNDQLFGGSGQDSLMGDGGNDTLRAGAGNDRLAGGAGNDTIDGGMGTDTAIFSGIRADYAIISSGNGYLVADNRALTPDGTDMVTNVDILQFADAVIVLGTSGNDTIAGDGTKNEIRAGAGNDSVDGGAEDDTIIGEAGADTLNGGTGNDSIDGGNDNDVVDGGSGDDVLIGGAGDDTISGGDGADTVSGGDGNDVITLGPGIGKAVGGLGADTITGGADVSFVNWKGVGYEDSAAAVNINLLAGSASGGSATGDVLSQINFVVGSGLDDTIIGNMTDDYLYGSFGSDSIDGGGGNDILAGQDYAADAAPDGGDTINGEAGNDSIWGQVGNDSLDGGSGDDFLQGGMGADTLAGGGGIDGLGYLDSASGVSVNLLTGAAAGGDATGDIIAGGDFRAVTGSAFDDTLSGTAGQDTLTGGDGADILTTNGGNDVVYGGNGNDAIFVSTSELAFPATDIHGGSGADSVTLSGANTFNASDILAAMTQVESIDFTAAGVVADFSNFQAFQAVAILGVSGAGNTLTLDNDGNDTFTVQATAGQSFTDDLSGNYVFYNDPTLQDASTEIARVSVI